MPQTIIVSGLGTGNVFIEDDDVPGNAAGRIRSAAASYSFAYPEDLLTFLSAVGQTLNFDLFDSLSAASLVIGDLANAANNPDAIAVRKVVTSAALTMVARNAISESGNDAAADIVAASLTLRAGTGIGGGNALETQVSNLEARTNTGDIDIRNLAGITIGGTAASFTGLSVETSGNIRVEALGEISLADADGAESIKAGDTSGDVTLIARGGGSITSTVNKDAITAAGGNIVLDADGNVVLGVAMDRDNDVRAKGSITVNAGGYFWIDGYTDFVSGEFGGASGGGITINADGGIYIVDNYGSDAGLAADGDAGADVTLTAGGGSTFSLQAAGATAVYARSGDVTASADVIMIASDSGITASKGVVTLRPTAAGRAIDIGSTADLLGALSLSDVELDRVFAPTLVIGGAQAGQVTVTTNITPQNAANLVVQSGIDIVVNSGALMQLPGKLELRAGDDIVLLAGSALLAPGGVVGYVDFGNTDPGTGGKAIVAAGFAAAVKFIGNVDDDTLFGGAAGDTLYGGGGSDILAGRAGADIYYVDNAGDTAIEAVGGGSDRILASASYTLAAGAEVEALATTNVAGTTAINLTGNAFAQTLTGNAGANTLNGMGGADAMSGGKGNDIYHVDNAGDRVTEAVGDGSDRIYASLNYTLASGVEVEVLATSSVAGTTAINLTGNAFAQALAGNAGANTLNGMGGADAMSGGKGNDIYYVDNAGDTVTEAVGGGSDRIYASVGYTLAAGVEVEALATSSSAGTTAINLTGNAFAQTLTGNAGANTLNGMGGADAMSGGKGNDIYYVDNAGDRVSEAAGDGSDRIYASVSFTLAAGVEVELLAASSSAGTTAINLAGNAFAQALAGNAGANSLNGMGGADTMSGGKGNDIYYVDNAGDTVIEAVGGGADRIYASLNYTLASGVEVEVLATSSIAGTTAVNLTGNAFTQTIFGNAGVNTLNGGAGNDTLAGGAGKDVFVFDTALSTSANVDKITDFNVADDTIRLENGIFTALTTGTFASSAFRANATGLAGDASDRIVYETDTGKLYYDSNGNAAGGGIHFATLGTGLALTNADFVVI